MQLNPLYRYYRLYDKNMLTIKLKYYNYGCVCFCRCTSVCVQSMFSLEICWGPIVKIQNGCLKLVKGVLLR